MNKFDEVNILGIKFHKFNVFQLINYVIEAAKSNRKTIISNVNIKAMNLAYELDWYRNFINNSDLIFCDGFGVLLGAKMLGYDVNSTHRMTCPDYIENLGLACEQHNVSLFLLAGKPGVVEKAMTQLTSAAPNLQVQGHHGYFEKTGAENERVIQLINKFNPGVLFVGFGMPLQEQWILNNLERINARVFLPLGACLDFYTGTVYRGPKWMTDCGLEWLMRLVVEPHRLWKRYIIGNPLFFYRIFKEQIRKRNIKLETE